MNTHVRSSIYHFVVGFSGASKGPYNWLTQSSLDTYSDVSMVPMDTQVSQSSLLFTVGTADSQGRPTRRPRPGAGFGKQRIAAPKPSTAVKKEGKKNYPLSCHFFCLENVVCFFHLLQIFKSTSEGSYIIIFLPPALQTRCFHGSKQYEP